MRYADLGTVSAATHRPQDLIPSFVYALKNLDEENNYIDTIQEGQTIINIAEKYSIENDCHSDECSIWSNEDTSYYLNEILFEALNNFAAPYSYFGSTEGNGSDFGFWVDYEVIEMDFDGLRVSDLSEVPEDYQGNVLVINDHGNCTLYQTVQKFREIWSIV